MRELEIDDAVYRSQSRLVTAIALSVHLLNQLQRLDVSPDAAVDLTFASSISVTNDAAQIADTFSLTVASTR